MWDGGEPSGATTARLAATLAAIRAWETDVPVDLAAFKLHANAAAYAEGEHATILGPLPPRGAPSGLVARHGTIIGTWGDPGRPDAAFSVTKAALAALAGVALATGRLGSLDERVVERVAIKTFLGRHNEAISWRHLLTLTSEWRGSLWGLPDSIDWHRSMPPRADAPPKGTPRFIGTPGGYWEFNDVRANVLALALTHLFGEGLEAVLRREVMDPIGASKGWAWHGYRDAAVMLADGTRVPAVAGGAHWGGGLVMSGFDLARLALLHLRRGAWAGRPILPPDWLARVATPTRANPAFGLMWWLNRDRQIPALSRDAVWAAGVGNLLAADPARDLVIVLRWFDRTRRDEMLARIVEALAG
jgi:CubicO group peptidase (beta-lactamase class C family)